MKPNKLSLRLALVAALLAPARQSLAQAVAVTMSLDAPTISVGQGTTLHVYAQVVPNLRTNTERIFSWYVDVLNTNGSAVGVNYSGMQKTTSDQDPQTSSTGVSQGANRRGIYDTFLNRPGAGTSNAVELMSIPVTGLAAGQTRFLVQAGSGVPLMSSDFLAVPKSGGQPFVGGDYSAAFVDLIVTSSSACALQLHIASLAGSRLQLTFTPCAGRNHTIEFRNGLSDLAGWQSVAGGPHNSGSITITNTTSQRFFRVRSTEP